jgi:ABC-type multidrug transport system ATPase subunit
LLTKTAQDRIVILSTHIIEDIEILCDHLAVIDSGSILWNGPLSDFVTDGPTIEQAYLRLIGER